MRFNIPAATALAVLLSIGAASAQGTAPATAPATKAPAPAPAAAPAAPMAAPAAPAVKATSPAMPAKAAGLVNINSATAEDLDKLPQIGPARSKAIIENRAAAKGGAYKDLADLTKRANLPTNAVDAIKDLVRFR